MGRNGSLYLYVENISTTLMDESKISISQNLSLQGDDQRKFIERKHLSLANTLVPLFFFRTTRTQSPYSLFTHILWKLMNKNQRKGQEGQHLFPLCIMEDVLTPFSFHYPRRLLQPWRSHLVQYCVMTWTGFQVGRPETI